MLEFLLLLFVCPPLPLALSLSLSIVGGGVRGSLTHSVQQPHQRLSVVYDRDRLQQGGERPKGKVLMS